MQAAAEVPLELALDVGTVAWALTAWTLLVDACAAGGEGKGGAVWAIQLFDGAASVVRRSTAGTSESGMHGLPIDRSVVLSIRRGAGACDPADPTFSAPARACDMPGGAGDVVSDSVVPLQKETS